MKSIRIAIYVLIAISFLRALSMKLCRPSTIKPSRECVIRRMKTAQPVLKPAYVRAVTPTGTLPAVACIDIKTATDIRDFLNARLPHRKFTAVRVAINLPEHLKDRVIHDTAVPLCDNICSLENYMEIFDALAAIQVLEN